MLHGLHKSRQIQPDATAGERERECMCEIKTVKEREREKEKVCERGNRT